MEKEKLILGCMVISYGILITIQINLFKELMEIKEILWKVAKDESTQFFFEKTNKKNK